MFDQPSGTGIPADGTTARKTHKNLSADDDVALFGLLAAAEKECLHHGNKIFQQLESMVRNLCYHDLIPK